MLFKKVYKELSILLSFTQSLALLFVRVGIAYGFYKPALLKWANIDSTSLWFAKLGFPLPKIMTLLSASVEIVGVVLLTIGLFTRIISLPLMVIMIVAIFIVHISNGFIAGNNGFEIPLYYLLFLSILASHGAGKFSLDYLFFSKRH